MDDDELPAEVRDYKLQTREGGNHRKVEHFVRDSDTPPWEPPRSERWSSVGDPIGKGGQGSVYRQICVSDGPENQSQRALKVVHCHSADAKRRYVRELETMVRFSHPQYAQSFVRLLGWFSLEPTIVYMAMEYMPDGDLDNYLRDKPPLPESDVQQIMSQVLRGLKLLHVRNIAHRDIKPKNVLLKRQPETHGPGCWWIKLADFGLSKETATDETTEVMGTPLYMAPELKKYWHTSPSDHKAADIWAVGVMTFQLLTKHASSFTRWRTKYAGSPASTDATPYAWEELSETGLAFILELTEPEIPKRLTADQALAHTWIKRCLSASALVLPTVTEPAESSAPSSARQSLEGQGGLTTGTLPSRQADTLSSEDPDSGRRPLNKVDLLADSSRSLPLVDDETNRGRLLSAARDGLTDLVKLLLDGGVSCHCVDNDGDFPLHYAAYNGHTELSELLITQGADLHASNHGNDTALHYAAKRGHAQEVRLLLVHGADINERGFDDHTPLSIAAGKGHEEVVKALIDNGANIHARSSHSWTAFHQAAWFGHVATAQLLAESGADLDSRTTDGITPLFRAAYEGKTDMVKLLLGRGANVETIDKFGYRYTPLVYASRRGHVSVVELLNDHIVALFAKRHKLGHLKPLATTMVETSYAIFPQRLKASSPWGSSTIFLGHDHTRKLFALSRGTAKHAGIGKSLTVHNGTSKQAPVLAAGGELLVHWSHDYPVSTAFQIAPLPGSEAAKKKEAELIILRARLEEDTNIVFFSFEVQGHLTSAHKSSDRGHPSNQAYKWVLRNYSDQALFIEQAHFALYRATDTETQASGAQSPRSPVMSQAPEELARVSVSRHWNKSDSFKLEFKEKLSTRGATAVLMTSLMIWDSYREGHASTKYLRKALGYSQQSEAQQLDARKGGDKKVEESVDLKSEAIG